MAGNFTGCDLSQHLCTERSGNFRMASGSLARHRIGSFLLNDQPHAFCLLKRGP